MVELIGPPIGVAIMLKSTFYTAIIIGIALEFSSVFILLWMPETLRLATSIMSSRPESTETLSDKFEPGRESHNSLDDFAAMAQLNQHDKDSNIHTSTRCLCNSSILDKPAGPTIDSLGAAIHLQTSALVSRSCQLSNDAQVLRLTV